jgi:hypothetical protein
VTGAYYSLDITRECFDAFDRCEGQCGNIHVFDQMEVFRFRSVHGVAPVKGWPVFCRAAALTDAENYRQQWE